MYFFFTNMGPRNVLRNGSEALKTKNKTPNVMIGLQPHNGNATLALKYYNWVKI